MSVTKHLLDVFRVDKQLRGLRSRLDAADRFLSQQTQLLADLEKSKAILEVQAKQLKAAAANDGGEAKRIEARSESLREQMNSSKTSKEYAAFQNELATLKTQKSDSETRVLESMAKADEVARQLQAVLDQHAERVKIVQGATADKAARNAEIKERLEELTAQRKTLAAAVPPKELAMLEQLIKSRGDEAMAPVEVLDRRSHEGSCSACMMAVPVEAVSALMSGKLVNCPSCRCVLYIEEATFAPAPKKGKSKAGAEA